MPVTIGAPPPAEGFVPLLLECHERIRRFSGLAVRLAEAGDAAPDEIADAAGRAARYFRDALPLHVADEEDLRLRVRGRDPALDAALDLMSRQHEEHEDALARLRSALDALARDPADPRARARLSAVAGPLRDALEAHLAHEEAEVLPRLDALLSPDEDAALVRALRARRTGR